MNKNILNELKNSTNVRSNLSDLRKELSGEGKAVFEVLSVDDIIAFLKSEDAKTRKNAALLLGDLAVDIITAVSSEANQMAAGALAEAYFEESTLFVKSSYLKALKNYNIEGFREKLEAKSKELLSIIPEESEKKHIAEECHALDELLTIGGRTKQHKFTGFDIKQEVVFVTNTLCYEELEKEFPGVKVRKHPFGVAVISEDLKPLLGKRFYREILFVEKCGEVFITEAPEKIGKALIGAGLVDSIKAHHAPSKEAFRFRLELKGAGDADETKLLKRIATELEQGSRYAIKNSAGDYELIIRLVADRNKKIHVFIRYNTLVDKRFAYRKEFVAASIQPANAGLFMTLAKPYLKENAQVIDPCCGVATMLIERNKVTPVKTAYAIDIFGEAVEKAKGNAKRAEMTVNFIHRDYLDFNHEYKFDEIISNLPQRGKKTREEHEKFYERFFDKSAEILADNGMMILYSNEKGFIYKQLRLRKSFKLVREFVIREKEEFSLYIIQFSK